MQTEPSRSYRRRDVEHVGADDPQSLDRHRDPRVSPAPNLNPNHDLGLRLHSSLFDSTHAAEHPSRLAAKHRQKRRQLHPALDLNLDLNRHPSLQRERLAELLEKEHRKTLAPLLGSMLTTKLRSFQA